MSHKREEKKGLLAGWVFKILTIDEDDMEWKPYGYNLLTCLESTRDRLAHPDASAGVLLIFLGVASGSCLGLNHVPHFSLPSSFRTCPYGNPQPLSLSIGVVVNSSRISCAEIIYIDLCCIFDKFFKPCPLKRSRTLSMFESLTCKGRIWRSISPQVLELEKPHALIFLGKEPNT